MSKVSIIVFAKLFIVYLFLFFYFGNWQRDTTSSGDSWGYFAYLPAVFVNGDIYTLEKTIATRKAVNPKMGYDPSNPAGIGEAKHVNGNQVIKYTCGVAMLESPFFLAGQFITKFFTDDVPNGYSYWCMLLLHLGIVVYTFAGALFIFFLLKKYVTEYVALSTIFVLLGATHLLYFTTYNNGMSHPYTFFLYSVVLYFTDRFFSEKGKWYHWLIVCFACGFVTIVRPSNLIVVIIPAVYGIRNFTDIRDRILFLWKHSFVIVAGVAVFFLPILPQLLYWKALSGSYIFYSYGNETFNFLQPHIKEGLIGFKNGWLPYTPVMALAIFGVFFVRKNPFRTALFLLFPLQVYIIYSWWAFWYFNGFGSRPMIDIYPLLAIPIASFFTFCNRNIVAKWLTIIFVLACTYQNFVHTYLYSKGKYWAEIGTSAFYFSTLFKTDLTQKDLILLDTDRNWPNSLVYESTFYANPLDTITLNKGCDANGKCYQVVAANSEFYGLYNSGVNGLQAGDWIRIKLEAYSPTGNWNLDYMNLLVCSISHDNAPLLWTGLRIENKLGNRIYGLWEGKEQVWDTVYYYVKLPKELNNNDIMNIHIWNMGRKELHIRNFSIERWK